MANEVIKTSIDDFIYSSIISNFIMATLAEHSFPMSWCKEFNMINEPSDTVDVGYFDSVQGAPDDDGVVVDTGFDATELVDIANTNLTSSKYSLTAAEYGIAMEIEDKAEEDSVSGINLMDRIRQSQQKALALAWTKDFVDLFSGLSNSVGTSGVANSVADMMAAHIGIRRRGGIADDGLVYVLNHKQAEDIESELMGTNAAAAVYASAADRLMAVGVGDNNGMSANRKILSFRGYPVYATGLNAQANGGLDEVGACFTPDGPSNGPYATFGNIIKRAPRLEMDRNPRRRTSDLVLTMRMAPGELHDATGTQMITGA